MEGSIPDLTFPPKWYEHVWYSQCIPRHAFILWMAVKGRLKTLDMISKWMEVHSMACYLCKEYAESHNHLFFSCPFSERLRERLKPMAKLEGSNIKSTSNVLEAADIWKLQVNKRAYYKGIVDELGKESDLMEF
ncbi:RNA-directed DNA polymerase, eukaryota, reverse transcriptase zinc-binding domain protein [Tanacetum coccineum]